MHTLNKPIYRSDATQQHKKHVNAKDKIQQYIKQVKNHDRMTFGLFVFKSIIQIHLLDTSLLKS